MFAAFVSISASLCGCSRHPTATEVAVAKQQLEHQQRLAELTNAIERYGPEVDPRSLKVHCAEALRVLRADELVASENGRLYLQHLICSLEQVDRSRRGFERQHEAIERTELLVETAHKRYPKDAK